MNILFKSFLVCAIGIFSNNTYSQINPGATCEDAGCSEAGSYPSLTDTPDMGSFDCLGTTPNPNWIAVGIDNPGNLTLNIVQSGGDVDFAAYGPYNSVTEACPIDGNTAAIDCSYSASASETVQLNNVQNGEVYIILITNYSNSPGTITVSPGAGSTATSNCNINFDVDFTITPDYCSTSVGTVMANPLSGNAPYSYQWNTPGNPTTQTITNVPAGDYSVTITSSPSPDGSIFDPYVANFTIPVEDATFDATSTPSSCTGAADGTASATFINPDGNAVTVTYLWNDAQQQTSQTAIDLEPGTYECIITLSNGCSGTAAVEVLQIPDMIGIVETLTPADCNSSNTGVMSISVSQGTEPYSYSWNNSPSTLEVANNLLAGNYTVTITDANGCQTSVDGIITEPSPLSIDFLTQALIICPLSDTLLDAIGSGGSSDYTYTWTENGNMIGTGSQISVDPEFTNAQYCVELSEACGSPTTVQCTNISFPTPIEPSATADMNSKCVPDTFYFQNTSTNSSEIATTFWEYGDNISNSEIINGNDPTSNYYNVPGNYSIILTTTSIYGCIYTDTMDNLIEVVPSPVADFNFSKNPTTIFETGILIQNKSSFDVVDWQYISPGSSPSVSSATNPAFMFPENKISNYPVTLIVANERGCTDTTTYYLQVVEDILFFAPNAFTPDGNEFNNKWKPEISGIDIYDFELKIYNRWGELIWENHDPSIGWDGLYHGKLVSNDTYIWVATVKNPYNDDKQTFNGSLVLLKGDSNFITSE